MIFFDIDETLLNQRQAEAAAARHFLSRYGELVPRADSVPAFCRQWRALRERHLPPFLSGQISFAEHRRRRIRDLFLDGARLSDREADRRFGEFLAEYRRAWCLFDDVLPCLDGLQDHRLGILSNGNSQQQRLKLRQTGIFDRFSVVVISEDIGCAKPRREIFEEACRQAGCSPAECVYVGDRLDSDARGSRAAGLRGVWLNRPEHPAPEGIETIRSLCDLPSLLCDGPPEPQPATVGADEAA